jgi:hypothetical protein
MKRIPLRLFALPATAALFAAAFGPIAPARAQTFSSSHTSTAEKDRRTVGREACEAPMKPLSGVFSPH